MTNGDKKLNMKTKLRNLLKSALIIAVVMCCFSCEDRNPTGTCVQQSYMGDMLYTEAKFKYETIWHSYDVIRLNTSDSIKLIRYKEADSWIKKFQKIDALK